MHLFCVLLFLPFLEGAVVYFKNYKLYEIEGNEESIKRLFEKLTSVAEIPYHEHHKSNAKIIIPPSLDKHFSQGVAGYKLTKMLLVDDYLKILEQEKGSSAERSSTSFWKQYHDIDEIYQYLNDVAMNYSWVNLEVAGRTFEKRQIIGLRINRNVNDETKKKVVIESGIHAREWIAPATTMYFINKLLTSSDPAIEELRDKFDWYIFPSVNPDGYHYTHMSEKNRFWRKNRSKRPENRCVGVDGNRNWDYHWGQSDTSNISCDEIYGGPTPFSEIETATFSSFLINNVKDIFTYISFHSYGSLLLLPYTDSKEHTGNYDDLKRIGQTSLKYGERVNGIPYKNLGTAAEILYAASGASMDWVRNKLNTPLVFTYELRADTPFHWPPERIPEQGEEVTQMLLGLFTEACSLGYC